MKERHVPIVMLTAYDVTMARLFDQSGVDILLLGDSLGSVILGLDTTIGVTLDAIIHNTRARFPRSEPCVNCGRYAFSHSPS